MQDDLREDFMASPCGTQHAAVHCGIFCVRGGSAASWESRCAKLAQRGQDFSGASFGTVNWNPSSCLSLTNFLPSLYQSEIGK